MLLPIQAVTAIKSSLLNGHNAHSRGFGSNRDAIYLKMAALWAENSTCERKKVGALIVKDSMIISDGYNGTPHGFDNKCEIYVNNLCEEKDLETKPEVLHAESNAITKLAKSTISSKGSTLYVTMAPCFECAKLIIQCEIKAVFYSEKYRDEGGLKLLKKAKIKTCQILL